MIIIITFTFFLSTLILHTFKRNLKRNMFFNYNKVNARLSLLKYVICDLSENKSYDRRESSLTKYYCIRISA